MTNKPPHRFQFSRTGGFDQARLESAEDLRHLGELDQKLWAALACPVKGLEFDERTLALIDADGDGRVRAPEVIAAVRWADEHLTDLGNLRAGAPSLPLASIKSSPGGKLLAASARRILAALGKADATAITLEDVADTARIHAGTPLNGDGIVPALAASDEATRKLIEEVIACVGSVPDRGGQPGVDTAKLELFFAQCAAFAAWAARSVEDPVLLPLKERTAAAHAAWSGVRAKVDDYFARCRLAAFDARAVAAVRRNEADYLEIAAKDMTISAAEIAGFPLASAEPSKPLPLVDGVNPAWAEALAAFRAAAVEPLLGPGKLALTLEEWKTLSAKLAPFGAWMESKAGAAVEPLGVARVREILAGRGKEALSELIARDQALEAEVRAISDVERLVRYHRDLYRLLHNFVNFADFYDPRRKSTFQSGVLYLDARASHLCVRVDDPGKHAALAAMAKTYLAYCDCTRKGAGKLMIAAAFTDGDSDFLMPGRNGVFYDRQGSDWDATVTKVIDNPISVRQAFWSPYKKLVRLIEERVAKRASEKEGAVDARLGATADAATTVKPPDAPKKMDVGTVAAISVAIAGIGALVTTLIGYLAGLFTLPFWLLCLAVAGILLIISGPSMLIAWLKLRQRNLGPILDANGWAVNGRVKMSVAFGKSLTEVAELPEGALPGADPFGDKPSVWPKLLKAALIVCFIYSFASDRGWLHMLTRPGTPFHDAAGFSLGKRVPDDPEAPGREVLAPPGELREPSTTDEESR